MKEQSTQSAIILSHEFKAPVSNLNLILETLYEYDATLSKYKKREFLELGLKEVERLKCLINYFLYLGRNKNNATKRYEILFPAVIKELYLIYQLVLVHKNSFLFTQIYGCNNFGYVCMNKELYCHVLLNLLANASKFTKEGKWILMENDALASVSLSSFSYDLYSRSAVIDHGVGFDDRVYTSIRTNTLVCLMSDRFGLSAVNDILSNYDLTLYGIGYPYRGAKLFFNMKFITK